MTLLLVILHIFVMFQVMVFAQSGSSIGNGYYHRSFLNFSGKFDNIRNLALDENSNTLYVGGRNILLAIDTINFNLIRNSSIDSNCRESRCSNDSLVLEVVQSSGGAFLFSCVLPTGFCEKRSLKYLHLTGTSKSPIASTLLISNVARLVNTKNNGQILYFARNFSTFPLQVDVVYPYYPILAVDPLSDDFSMKDGGLSMEMNHQDFEMDYPIDFKAIVESDSFVYFLSNQNESTKISKICKSSPHRNQAYEDIFLTCSRGDTQYPFVKDAVMLKENGQSILVTLFTLQEESDDPEAHGVICVFSENQLLENFLKSRKERYECPARHLPQNDFIFKDAFAKLPPPNQCINGSSSDTPLDYNRTIHESNYCANSSIGGTPRIIIGFHTLHGEANVTIDGSPTNITARQIGNTGAFYVGDSIGTIREFSTEMENDNTGIYIVQEVNSFRLGVPEKVMDLVTSKDSLFVATRERVVKIKVQGECGQFDSCSSCMASRVSKCGWCVMENKCTESGTEICRFYEQQNHWLPVIKNKCLKINFKEGARQPLSDAKNVFKPSLQLTPMISRTNFSFWCRLEDRTESPLNFTGPFGTCAIDGQKGRNHSEVTAGRKTFTILAKAKHPENNTFVTIATSDFEIYDCSSYTTCFDCLSERACKWNDTNLRCGDKGTITDKMECPYVIGNQKLKIANNKLTQLVIHARNLVKMGDFYHGCKIGVETFRAAYNITHDLIICQNVTINAASGAITNLLVTVISRRENGEEVVTYTLLNFKKSQTYVEAYSCAPLLQRFASRRTDDCSSCKYLSRQGYECDWCTSSSSCTSGECSNRTVPCGPPELINITPDKGPIEGGTRVTIQGVNLGMNSSDLNITIGGQQCSDVIFDNSRRVVCTTGKISQSEDTGSQVVVERKTDSGVIQGNLQRRFYYQTLGSIELLEPRIGIKSGNAIVSFKSQFIDQRAKIKFIGEKSVYDCAQLISSAGKVKCLSPKVEDDETGMYNITVMYDGVNVTLEDTYEIISDPEIIPPSELKTIRSGGLELKISARGPFDFGIVSEKHLRVGNASKPCIVKGNAKNAVFCTYPPFTPSRRNRRRRKRDVGAEQARLELDGLSTFLGFVRYVEDPKFKNLTAVFEYDPTIDKMLELYGESLTTVTSNPEHYNVYIGSGLCHSENLTSSLLTCKPPEKEPSPWRGDKKLIIRVEIGFKEVVVGEAKYITEFQWLIAVIAALCAVVLVTIIVMAVIVYRVRRRSKKREHEILMEMQRMEDDLREEGRDEFATMQLTITNIKTDLVSTGIPFNAYDIYVMKILFPNSEHETINKTLLHKDLVPSKGMRTAMDQFEGLLRNRFFVRCLIGSLERQKKITMQDKAQLSSLFTLVFLGRMKDFYEIVKCLLENLVDSTPKKQHRVIFNRIENITLRLLINWLYIALFPHFKDGGGTSLFMLYKAILTVVEKRPVDCVTGDAKNTLSQHRFLRCKVDFNIMTLTIDLNGDGHEFSCEVLDCDTISQVKQKCLRQIYKNRPASQMPSTDELILEWKMGHGKLALNDFDHTSVREGNKIQMNTLKHYNVKDKSNMELHYKFSPPNPDGNEPEETYENYVKQPSSPNAIMLQMPTLVTEESLEKMERWHLDEVVEESTPDDTNITARHLKEEKGMHITSLMHTKLILQEYIRTLLDQILDENIQSIVHYVFGTLNTIAESKGVDPDVLQCWKSESYAIRIWASLVATPDVLFDVDRPKHIEPSLDSIRQLIIDCFHNTKITKDSSLQKLLFATEVPEYQKKIDIFYKRLSQLECIGEGQFANEMTKLSNMQQSSFDFKKLPVLLKIYKFIQSYIEDVLEDLDDDEDAKSLDLRAKLETVIEQMDQDE